MNSKALFCCFAFPILSTASSIVAADSSPAATATNEIGVDLYRKLATGENNLCFSPLSIEMTLAMAFEGAEGQTRKEMARVLHLTSGDSVSGSFRTLRDQFEKLGQQDANESARQTPFTLLMANRLFAQTGYDFRQNFLALLTKNYGAPIDLLDFRTDPTAATRKINDWVSHQTRGHISDLTPAGALGSNTLLVLTNAVYLNAPWANPFLGDSTREQSFRILGGDPQKVPTMHDSELSCGYLKQDGFTAVAIPYRDSDLQLLVLLPDQRRGLHSIEKKITSALLAQCAKLKSRDLNLYLPKFNFKTATLDLTTSLQSLGMKTAFDQPPGTANFDRMVPREESEGLHISDILHKAFIAVDEEGTEAGAETALPVTVYSAPVLGKPKPIEVRIDRPFFFAIQHKTSGACLFVGRVTDPREL